MKKFVLIELSIFAIFLIVVGIFMYDNKHKLHLIPERNQTLKEGILIGRLKAHGFYKRIEKIYVFQQDTVKSNEIAGPIDLFYCGPAMSEREAQMFYDTLRVYMEDPAAYIKKLQNKYNEIH